MAYIPTRKTDFDTRLAHLLPHYSHAPPDARITELLHTNAPPTPVEKKILKATLSETPDRVVELNSLIDSTTSLLRYLTEDRNQALETKSMLKRSFPHVVDFQRRFLTEIVIRCLPSYHRGGSPLDPRAMHWTLLHVCRKWKEVAIGTPEIWSNIRLDFVGDRFLNGNCMYEAAFMLGVVLDRARPHDLHVLILFKDDISMHPICVVLLPTTRYWKSLELYGGCNKFDFLSPCRGFFPRLETAQVVDWDHEGSEAIDIFAVAPRLRHFEKILNAPFLLPANLVKFSDGNLFNETTCSTLRHLVNIQILSLSCSSYSSQSPRIQPPRVSELELSMGRQNTGPTSLTYNHFDLPSLTHLKVMLFSLQPMVPQPVPQPMHSSMVTCLTLTWSLFRPHKFSAVDIEQDLSSYNTLRNLHCLTVKDCPNISPFLLALSIRFQKERDISEDVQT